MKRRAFLFYRLAIIASVSISSVIWARPKGDVWVRKRTPMPSQRVEFDTSAVNGKIYVIGGTVWDDRPRLGRVLRTFGEYDPVTNQWQLRASMRIGRTDLSTAVVNGKIYAIGGPYSIVDVAKACRSIRPRGKHLGNEGGYVRGKAYFLGERRR